MFAPTKTWRKWHRKVNVTQKRYAVASAVAASGVPALVMARGHRIEQTPEGPLVIGSAAETVTKTSAAVALLKSFGAYEDVEKVVSSKTMRAGKGKMRNRRFVQRRGPLVVYGTDGGLTKAFRNIPGVELTNVDSLNLLQLAPGGHLGRFCIWTESAFEKLDAIFGTTETASSTKVHNGNPYRLPRAIMTNSDLSRIINSDEVQSVVLAPKTGSKAAVKKVNPLKGTSTASKAAMDVLNPAMATLKRKRTEEQTKAEKAKKTKKTAKKSVEVRKGKTDFYKSMVADN